MVDKKGKIEYVIIACCTYKRQISLEKTLNSLLNLNFPDNIKTEILVVDNDKASSSQKIVEKLKGDSKITIHYVTEDNLGLSNVRNKALQESISFGATHLAFIDDDEIADKNWLINHIDFYNSFENIAVSSGPTYKKFDKDYPTYIINCNLFKGKTTKQYGQIRHHCATGNVFFNLNITKDSNLYFSEEHNFLGGEDGDFFSRASDLGYIIRWNNKAINYELVGDDRANIIWLLSRSYYNGYSGSVVKLKRRTNIFKRYFYAFKKLLLIPVNAIITLLSILLGKTVLINSLCLMFKNTGKLVGAINLKPIMYYQRREVNGD